MPISAFVQTGIFLLLTAVVLFASAGTLAIPLYWVYFAVIVAFSVLMLATLPADLIQERMRPGGQKVPARLQLVSLLLFAHWVLAGLDRGRFHWSDSVPLWLRVVGLLLFAGGLGLFYWAMRVNRFFSSVARIQADRGQVVIDTGPYAVVRHPGYSAAVMLIIGSGLALCSWLATALLIVAGLPMLFLRAIGEDRMLHADLPGYRDYAQRVRWRMLPGVW
ncbi:MAG TPA: isoprenylcysteine carboxylmethyltransferase family protein [Pseudolabrys sp.]|nr:isoprenylcysteine carboxylmethyltransferase family protein [Pseudolabrys sp.]